jgi:hypothetical protein
MDTNHFTTLINNINLFSKKLEKNITYTNPFTLKINVKVFEKQELLSDQCIAVVQTLSGSCYQCTRKKKFNNFCGLHHERKSSFKTIYDKQLHKSVNTNVSILCNILAPPQNINKYVLDDNVKLNNEKNNNVNEIQHCNNDNQEDKIIDDIELHSIYYKGNLYHIHKKTSSVYYEDCGDFVYIGPLNSLAFSIRIY